MQLDWNARDWAGDLRITTLDAHVRRRAAADRDGRAPELPGDDPQRGVICARTSTMCGAR